MQYDPIKDTLGRFFAGRPLMRRLFYRALDILLLRSWHIRSALRSYAASRSNNKCLRVLDAGSGFGQYSWYMARSFRGWLVTGVDIKQENIAECTAFVRRTGKQNIRFRIADLRDFVMPGSYDLILSVDVMEHIREDEKVFHNFRQSLRPGGMLLLNTPSDKGGSGVKNQGDPSFIDEHVRDGYSPDEITKKLSNAGFKQIETRYTYGTPGRIAWHISMKIPMRMLGWSKVLLAVLPVYYLVCMPLVLALNYADLKGSHTEGTGLMVKAIRERENQKRKP